MVDETGDLVDEFGDLAKFSINHSSLEVYWITKEGRFVYVNDTASKRLGYTKDELKDMCVWDVDPEYEKEDREKQIRKLKKEGSLSFESIHKTKDDKVYPVEITNHLIEFEGKEYIFAFVKDITERKRAENELRYRENLERIITEISTNLMNIDLEKIDERINQALKKVGEFADADRSYIFQFDEDLEKMDNTHEWCAEGVKSQKHQNQGFSTDNFSWLVEKFKEFENVFIPKVSNLPPEAKFEKKVFQNQNIKSLLLLPIVLDESLKGFIGFDEVKKEKEWSEDIINLLRIAGDTIGNTLDRKEMEEELRKNQEKFEKLFYDSPEPMILIDEEDRIYDINTRFEEEFGYEIENIKNKDVNDVIVPERLREEGKKLDKKGKQGYIHYETVRKGKDGEIPVSISGMPITINEETYTLGIYKNIEERKKAQEGIFKNLKKRKKAEEKKDFLYTLLRQDLGSKYQTVQGYLQLLEEADLTEEHQEYLEKAIKAGRKVDDVLGLAKKLEEIEGTDWTGERDLVKDLEHVLDNITGLREREKVEIQKNYPESMSLVEGDYSLKTLLTQILVSRIQISKSNKIKIEAEEKEKEILLKILDDGEKLPEDIKEIFEGEVYTGETTGVGGVRYYMLREIARHINAEIKVKDSGLGGSRFDIHLQKP